jgi:hypothetical protein
MKYYSIFALLLSLSLLTLSCSKKQTAAPSPFGKVRAVTGKAQVWHAGSGVWDSIRPNSSMAFGDSVKTGLESSVEIVFNDSNTVQVDEDSKIMIGEAQDSNSTLRTVVVSNIFGTVLSNIENLSGGAYRVETPTAVASIRGTFFAVTFELSTQNSDVQVFAGNVWVRNPQAGPDVVIIEPGNAIVVQLGKIPGTPARINFGQWKKMQRIMHREKYDKFNKLLFTQRVEKRINLKDARQNLLKKSLERKQSGKPGKAIKSGKSQVKPAAPAKSTKGKAAVKGKGGKGK